MKKKKILSALVALAMILSSLSITALASEQQKMADDVGINLDVQKQAIEELPPLPAAPQYLIPDNPNNGKVYVYLARHGQTLTNASYRSVSGQGSAPLTEEGREVAKNLGLGLSDVYFKSVHSSTLSRTYETAQLILSENQTDSKDMAILQHEDLRETDMGSFESRTYREIIDEGHSMDILVTFLDSCAAADPDGEAESYEVFLNRVWKELNLICQEAAKDGGGNVLIVAHGNVNSVISRNISYENARTSLDNSSIVLLEYDQGKINLLSFNDRSYIEKGQMLSQQREPVELNLVVTGETKENSRGRICNVIDNALTEKGLADMAALGQTIGEEGFRAVYSSDQWKEVNSAKAVIAQSGNPNMAVNTHMGLRGVSTGYFEGELLEKSPELPENAAAKEIIEIYCTNDPTNSAETYNAAKARIIPAYKEIAEHAYERGGGNILVTAPGITHLLAVEELTGQPLQNALDPGTVITLIYDGTAYYLK